MIIFSHILGLLGQIAIGFALVVLARLSQRLGHFAHARPYYMGHYIAAVCIWSGALARFYFITRETESLRALSNTSLYILGVEGLPAIGVTIGLVVTWYYWSWLLAERD
jgi:hypothetical protein